MATEAELPVPALFDRDQQQQKMKAAPVDPEELEKALKAEVNAAKRNRRQYYSEWKRNVELRLGNIATLSTGGLPVSDKLQTEINPDWTLTKTKTANLFSQLPVVQATHLNKKYAPAI